MYITNLQTLYSLMNITFIGYIVYIVIKYGIQTSVSESYYKLPRNRQWLFTVFTWTYSLLALIIGLELKDTPLVFLSASGIFMVGTAPAFHSKDGKHTLEGIVHTVGASVGILFMFIYIGIDLGYWYIALIFTLLTAISYFIKVIKNNYLWWIEIYAYMSLNVVYYLNLY
jgi:hypothetical protein